jgi:hypothetical protein
MQELDIKVGIFLAFDAVKFYNRKVFYPPTLMPYKHNHE